MLDQQKISTKGILVFALGHPYYGRYAFNLAISLKAVENIEIALVHDNTSINHLDKQQRAIFDLLIPSNLPAKCGSKLHAYNLSPFDKTLVLDADMLWLPLHKPSQLFDDLNGTEFTGITEGSTNKPSSHYFFWAGVDEIRSKYEIKGTIYQWRTEVMYFEKSEKIKQMFDDAISINDNHGLSTVKEFAEGVPDELAINIAAAKHGISPHKDNWQPSYWPQLFQNQIPQADTLYREYYLLSAGGNMNTENVKQLYNRLVQAQAPKIGYSFCFALQSKHQFLTERRKS
jgi:hypothetical protein